MSQNLIRAIVLVLATAGTALASEPQDCGNEDYIGQFLDAPNATDFECQKPYIRNFESSGEARIARVIVDANAKDLIPDETIAALRKGIDAAIELFARLPNVKLQHVTVFAYNG